MKYRKRIYYSEADKELMWDRWQAGESLDSIARLFDRNHPSIQGILARTGGIRPPKRRRSRLALTIAEREEISRGVVAGRSIRSIATELGRSPSTVSRELRRNGGRRRYRANKADKAAWQRARRPKTCKLAQNRVLASLPGQQGQPGVTRDNLQEPVQPDSRCLEERAVEVSEAYARNASFPPPYAERAGSWPDRRCCSDQ